MKEIVKCTVCHPYNGLMVYTDLLLSESLPESFQVTVAFGGNARVQSFRDLHEAHVAFGRLLDFFMKAVPCDG